MSEQRLERLDRAVERLMQAQREALETCERALDYDDEILDRASAIMDDAPAAPFEEGRRYRVALEGVLDILAGASEDVQEILEAGDGDGN